MPVVAERPLIPWRRFWRQFGESVHVGEEEQGFLTDPEGQYTRFYYNQSLKRLDQLLGAPCLVLCGDPGIGKSTELGRTKVLCEQSLRQGDHLIWLEFRDIPNEAVFGRKTVDSPAWKEWRDSAGKMILLVDSVDEGLIKIPDFIPYLSEQLRGEPLDRLQLVLACRSAEWPVHSGGSLISLWEQSEKPPIFELCPLREQDARMAAEAWQLNADLFLQAIYERRVIGLAALPTTLFFLIKQFQRSGTLSDTHRDLYEEGCKMLAQEQDPRRIESLRALRKSARVFTPEEIHYAASRTAALLLVCGKSAIRTSSISDDPAGSANGDLDLSDTVDQTGESSPNGFPVSQDLLLYNRA